MTTKLQLYKRAAHHVGHTPPASLTEAVEVRRACDDHYDDVLDHMLEHGFWTDAMRSVEITENTAVTEEFGFSYAHDLPTDYVRKYVISASEFFDPPLDQFNGGDAYLIEQDYIWSNVTPLYMRYVSNDTSFGLDLTKWTERMAEAASLELASRICKRVTGSESEKERLMKAAERALGNANTFDSLEQPTQTGRSGRWVNSRNGRRGGRSDYYRYA